MCDLETLGFQNPVPAPAGNREFKWIDVPAMTHSPKSLRKA